MDAVISSLPSAETSIDAQTSIVSRTETATGAFVAPPPLARLALGVLMPNELEKEFIEDFDELYATWAIPTYGSRAPLWAWGQVLKTIVVMVHKVALEFWGKVNKRAK